MLVHDDMNNVLGQVATRALVFGHCSLANAAHCRALFDVDLVFLPIVVRIARRLGLYRRRLGVRGTAVELPGPRGDVGGSCLCLVFRARLRRGDHRSSHCDLLKIDWHGVEVMVRPRRCCCRGQPGERVAVARGFHESTWDGSSGTEVLGKKYWTRNPPGNCLSTQQTWRLPKGRHRWAAPAG